MRDPKDRYLSVVTGISTAVGLIGFFLLMSLFDLHKVTELRYLNFFILGGGVFYTLKYYRDNFDKEMSYFKGMAIGLNATLYAVMIFAAFMFTYLHINSGFMQFLMETAMFGDFLNPAAATIAIIFEGFSSGVILNFIALQYFKKDMFKEEHKLSNYSGSGA